MILVGAGAAVSTLVAIALALAIFFGHLRAPWVWALGGFALGIAFVCGLLVWRAFAALARM